MNVRAGGGVCIATLDLARHPRCMSPTGQQSAALAVHVLGPEAACDTGLVDHLTGLINEVYATAESGLWRAGTARMTTSELAELIRAQEIAVATRHSEIVGSVHVHDAADGVSVFGALVSAPDQRNRGVGRALIAFAEQHSRERGMHTMRLELLVPREWRHPTKEFLKGWYGRLGYRLVRTGSLDDDYAHLAPRLATACDLTIYEKPL